MSLGGLTILLKRVEQRAHESAIGTARIVATLTVHRNVTESDFDGAGGLSPTETADLDGDVAALVAEQRLVGFEVWKSDGRLLYADANDPAGDLSLTADERLRMQLGAPWVTTHDPGRAVPTIGVFLPYDAGTNGVVDGLVEVLIPEASVARSVATTSRQLYVVTVLLLIVCAAGWTTLRRRLIKRDRDATHDRLTGLLNWGGFRDAVEQRIVSDRLNKDGLGALLLVDLDGFKPVNDSLGHPAGDTLLKLVGKEIRASVPARDLVGRLGGDEFAVLLSGLAEPGDAARVASQLLERLRGTSFEVEGLGLGIEASIGVALIPLHGADVDVLLRRVDAAMYQAKRTGVGVATYNESADSRDVGHLTLLGELRRAIDNDELVLYYQPKADLADRHVAGVEALVRWQHPTRGLVPPDSFIPLAERTGLLGPLTHWVLARAVQDAARWHRSGLPLSIAINVSPRSLLDGNLLTSVVELLASTGLPSKLLEIEVTETAIMTDPAGSTSVLRQLRATGVRISIDDFGSGYTSLAYLKSLPVDEIKIDRSLITDLLIDDKGLAVTQSIIELGHRLGLSVLAEGIETEEIWQRLQVLGCDQGQGYHLARPMPAEQIEGWITAHQHTEQQPPLTATKRH